MAAEARTTATDVGRRGAAMAVAAAGAVVYVVLAIAIYSVLEEKAEGGAIVFFVIALGVLAGVFMPLVSFIHRLWRSGDAQLRSEHAAKVALERDRFETTREYERRRRADRGNSSG